MQFESIHLKFGWNYNGHSPNVQFHSSFATPPSLPRVRPSVDPWPGKTVSQRASANGLPADPAAATGTFYHRSHRPQRFLKVSHALLGRWCGQLGHLGHGFQQKRNSLSSRNCNIMISTVLSLSIWRVFPMFFLIRTSRKYIMYIV